MRGYKGPGKRSSNDGRVSSQPISVRREADEGLHPGMASVEGTVSSLQAMLPLQRAEAVQRLQQTKGNGFVQRVQTKMTVGSAGDSYEHEADRVAERVMRMLDPQTVQSQGLPEDDLQRKPIGGQITRISRQIKPEEELEEEEIQLKGERGGFAVPQAIESRLEARRGGGQPLSTEVRGFMEPRFGADFSGVRLHSDPEGGRLSEELGARAFTRGQDIYIGSGQDPRTNSGQRLIAHELTHVVQQGSSTVVRRVKKPWTLWFSKKRKAVNALEKAIKGNNINTVNAKAAELIRITDFTFYLKLMKYELERYAGDPAKWKRCFFSYRGAFGSDPLTVRMLQANDDKLDPMSTEMADYIASNYLGGLSNYYQILKLMQIPQLTRVLKRKCSKNIWANLVGSSPVLSILQGAGAIVSKPPISSNEAFTQADLIFSGFLTGGHIPLHYQGTHGGKDVNKALTIRSGVDIATDCHHLAQMLKNVFQAWPGHPKVIQKSINNPILTKDLSTMNHKYAGLISSNYSGNVLIHNGTNYVPAKRIFFSAGKGVQSHSWVRLQYGDKSRSYDPVFGTVGNQVSGSVSEGFRLDGGIYRGTNNVIIPVDKLKKAVKDLLPTIQTQYKITSLYVMVASGGEANLM